MSDDDDYMSDKFLQGTNKSSSSLIYRHADKRKFELLKKKTEIEERLKEKNSVIKHIEQEKREEGLSSAITSTNKGFEMLMKMGYKPGQGIGKTESGRVEPIGLQVKLNRHGLGKPVKKEQVKSKGNLVNDKLDSKNMKDFRSRIAQKKMEQLLKADLYKSQKICNQLDMKLGIEKPMEIWFWPVQDTESDSDSDSDSDNSDESDDESLLVDEKLQILTKYLREKHFYCIWCGVAFQSEDDLRDDCPGNTRNDH